ncbi:hypothetical protein V1478_001009 [Vespula squamosa]|uniref:Uncharacterized protein n=1 Tax=Vespula squamosa TaxID=30214 RepID=A0ABD2C963_VESSQ
MVKKRIGRKRRWKGVKEEKEKEEEEEEEEEEVENEAECGDCDAFRSERSIIISPVSNTRLTNNNDDEDSERVCLPSYYRRNYRAHSDGLG